MTSNSVLVDTCVIIDFSRREKIRETYFYELAEKEKKLAISVLTHAELYAGKRIWKSQKAMNELIDILSGMDILYINESISKLAGRIRAEQEVDLADAIIAATAIENELSLATLNKKHFEGIDNLRLTVSK